MMRIAVADDHRDFIYRDDAMSAVVKLALQIAPSDASVLITGESGTGKEVLAHWNGDAKIEARIKEETGLTTRNRPFDLKQEPGKCVVTGEPSPGRIVFSKFLPIAYIEVIFVASMALALIGAAMGGVRYWRAMSASGNGHVPRATLLATLADIFKHRRFSQCREAPGTRETHTEHLHHTHLAVFYGFLGLVATTTSVGVGIYAFYALQPYLLELYGDPPPPTWRVLTEAAPAEDFARTAAPPPADEAAQDH